MSHVHDLKGPNTKVKAECKLSISTSIGISTNSISKGTLIPKEKTKEDEPLNPDRRKDEMALVKGKELRWKSPSSSK